MPNIIALNRRAVRQSIDTVSRVTPADLDRPTPCEGWTLRDLLAHMTAQHRGFAAAARGKGEDLAVWETRPGEEYPAAYREAAEDVLEAFAKGEAEVFALPELGAGVTVPAAKAIGFHFIDYVVHAWDVAVSLDIPFETPDEESLEAALAIARAVPQGDHRLQEGAAFGPALEVGPGATPFDEVLLLLGRTPRAQRRSRAS
ncbi:TIGR03086 family metal-binding protein [Actinomadura sp. 21ATH]|uniref:TIGR03086 family metal-binding protein n=1 Tax=Actinomadura sp. 21ATH TaxID=1735444 RepID=UPI0035BECC16